MRALIWALLVTATLVAGCTADPPAARPELPGFTSSAAPSTAQQDRTVPKTCGGVATVTEVTDLLGTAVTGQTLPIVGVPEPKIGRTARIDCYYGVPDGQPVSAAAVWIALATYTDRAAAHRRMTSTIETEREAGAKANEVPVGSDRGILLTGTTHTLVATRGATTVVVTVAPTLIAADQAASLLGRLADRALTPR